MEESGGSLLFILFVILCSVLQIVSGMKKPKKGPSPMPAEPGMPEEDTNESPARLPDVFPDDLPGMPPVFRFPNVLKTEEKTGSQEEPAFSKPFSFDEELEKYAFSWQKKDAVQNNPISRSVFSDLPEETEKASVSPEAFPKDGVDIRSAILYDALLHPKFEE